MFDFDCDEEREDGARQAYCAACRDVVPADERGCIVCAEEGSPSQVEPVIAEPLPPNSPRSVECPTCGAEIGEYCYPATDENGGGYNHEARVEEVDDSEGRR